MGKVSSEDWGAEWVLSKYGWDLPPIYAQRCETWMKMGVKPCDVLVFGDKRTRMVRNDLLSVN